MLRCTILLFLASATLSVSLDGKFPPGFKFGAATSSFQVEGAWNVTGKGENKWDRLMHVYPGIAKDYSNGDVACKSYHLWERDIEIASELGLDTYRFSINWPRLLPTGFPNNISQEGKKYYNDLINGLLARGIEPIVTLYHWEMPQVMHDQGGWTCPHMPNWFADYARVVFSLFADRVKTWITVNEPIIECEWFYGMRLGPAGTSAKKDFMAANLCNKYILIGHAKAWRIYDEEFRPKYHGRVSIANLLFWFEPQSHEDKEIAEHAREFFAGRYSHPILSKEGGWPPVVEDIVNQNKTLLEGRATKLPVFSPEEIKLVRGTYDFYGVNHYSTRLVRKNKPGKSPVIFLFTYMSEIDAVFEGNPDWVYGYNDVIGMYPEGLRAQLTWLRDKYGDMEVIITENGWSTSGANNDDDRISFIRGYLEQVLLSIQDGINVTGYIYWSMLDSFEWLDGYQSKFGLYEVDFQDPNRTRKPRSSAKYFANITKHRCLDIPHEPGHTPLQNAPNSGQSIMVLYPLKAWMAFLAILYTSLAMSGA